jgi:flavin reductase (DIM6/NTAB) family NADH-FMN oxidoreductase RutF
MKTAEKRKRVMTDNSGGNQMGKINMAPECVFCPQPVYIIGTSNPDGTPDFCIITWIGFVWDKNPHLMLCIGGSKRTKDNIFRTGEFSANLVSRDILQLADYFGNSKGENGPKDALPYEYSAGKKIQAPVLQSSRWIFECTVEKTVNLDGSDIFISKIDNIQTDENLKDIDKEMIDLKALDPVLYAPYNYYSVGDKLGECGFWNK